MTEPVSTMSLQIIHAAGDLVLDPFAGSGTVGVVALRLGRRATLIEISQTSIDIAKLRINGPLFA